MSLLQVQGDFSEIVLQYSEDPYPALDFSDYQIRKNKTAFLAVLFYKFLSSNGVRNYRFTVIVFLENHIQV
ncbi:MULTISPECIES: hypothetical protein [unclassified Pasteurella]|uniref:hypothetical protein n=1 Tax=unclassified Pasteurella TaxID=2621516 RepID=UPI0010745A35|nr:hypothetical protein [Pasteurella sp. 19428wF3_WM03]TFU49370.1 hypothetical protein E4T92_10920 [Pasteurella sp. WM03]